MSNASLTQRGILATREGTAGRGAGILFVLELRGPLFHERRHTLLLVRSRKDRLEKPPFEADSFGKRGFEGAADRILGHDNSRQRHACNLLGGFHRLGNELSRRYDARNKPPTLGLGCVHVTPRQAEVHGLRLTYSPGQPLRSARAGNSAQHNLRLAEARSL